jgi:hypothetical protein
VDKINLLSKFVYPENFDNPVKNRFLEVALLELGVIRRRLVKTYGEYINDCRMGEI